MESTDVISQLGATIAADAGGDALFRAAIVSLATGALPTASDLATELRWSVERVESLLARVPSIERDDSGRIVGAGLTTRETQHVFEVDGRKLFTWCALDTLIFPIVIGSRARVSSPCAATGAPVTLDVTPDGVRSVAPTGAVVSIALPTGESCDVRRAFCDHVHFFSSEPAAAGWRARHPDGVVMPIADAFALAKVLATHVFATAATGCCGA
jgi:alkylmercury lyase